MDSSASSPPPGDTVSLDATARILEPRETLRHKTVKVAPRLERWEKNLPRIALDPPAAPAQGSDLETRGLLGEGGVGRVLLAWQRSLQREVAVKTSKASALDEEARHMVLLEGRVTGSLEHPGIVPVHALAMNDRGEPLLVMKRIDGTSWRDLLRDPGHAILRLLPGGAEDPLQAHLFILAQVCNAVHFAHSRGVIHRDIKPANIMVGAFGEVYLLDWGAAAEIPDQGEIRTDVNELVGTPAYMAPEMVTPSVGPIDARTDVYLLGAALHEVLAGEPPHRGRNAMEALFHARLAAPPAFDPDVPAELAEIAARALARDPAKRPQTALALRQAIDGFLRHRGAESLRRTAEDRLADLRRLIARGEEARGEVRRVGIECRFAFHMALAAWPESAAAQAGRDACLRLLCEDAIQQKQAGEAEALIAEISAPDPALRDRLDALIAELTEERTQAEALRRLAHDQDERVGARARMYLVVLGLACVAIAILVQGTNMPTYRQMAALVTMPIALGSVVSAALWRMLGNAYSRRMIGLLLFLCAVSLAEVLIGWARGTPMRDTLVHEMITRAALLGGAVVLGHVRLLPGALVAVVGATLGIAAPSRIGLIFPATAILTLLACAALNVRTRDPRAGITAPP